VRNTVIGVPDGDESWSFAGWFATQRRYGGEGSGELPSPFMIGVHQVVYLRAMYTNDENLPHGAPGKWTSDVSGGAWMRS
jgi:hypothetical protein